VLTFEEPPWVYKLPWVRREVLLMRTVGDLRGSDFDVQEGLAAGRQHERLFWELELSNVPYLPQAVER